MRFFSPFIMGSIKSYKLTLSSLCPEIVPSAGVLVSAFQLPLSQQKDLDIISNVFH